MIERPNRDIEDREEEEWEHPTPKRMRFSPVGDRDEIDHHPHERPRSSGEHSQRTHNDDSKQKSITIASSAKNASQVVAPFLNKHIPTQYAPQVRARPKSSEGKAWQDPNTKFCYRHRPDMLCRRQADQLSMLQIQQGLESLPEADRQGVAQVWSLFSAAPSKHRMLMLQGILTQCCFPQLSYLSAHVRDIIRIDFVAALPSEIAFRILCFLDTGSLCRAAQVSRRWRELAEDDVVWHRMCTQHIHRKCTKCGWGLPRLEKEKLRALTKQTEFRRLGQAADGSVTESSGTDIQSVDEGAQEMVSDIEKASDGTLSPVLIRTPGLESVEKFQSGFWKDVYRDRYKVGANWKNRRYELKVLKGHNNGVMAIAMYQNFLATGSYDDTVKIWDLTTGEELRTLRGHTMGIRCLQMDENTLISGSLDRTMKVWDWRKGECKATYTGHSAGIISLHFDTNLLASGSIDRTARIWNFTDKSVSTLRGHTDWVNSVRIDSLSRTVFTGSDDCTIKIWDLDTKRCIRTFEGHVGQVQQVVLLSREFDVEDMEQDVVDADHQSEPDTPSSSQGTACSPMLPGQESSPVLAHRSFSQAVNCPWLSSQGAADAYNLVFSDPNRKAPPRYMLSSALDSTIRLWEISTGRCIRTFFGHVEGVWALAADTLRIVSGAEDRMVKVWDPRTGRCENTFTGHMGPVTCVDLSDSRLVTAGEDGEVRVYGFAS